MRLRPVTYRPQVPVGPSREGHVTHVLFLWVDSSSGPDIITHPSLQSRRPLGHVRLTPEPYSRKGTQVSRIKNGVLGYSNHDTKSVFTVDSFDSEPLHFDRTEPVDHSPSRPSGGRFRVRTRYRSSLQVSVYALVGFRRSIPLDSPRRVLVTLG